MDATPKTLPAPGQTISHMKQSLPAALRMANPAQISKQRSPNAQQPLSFHVRCSEPAETYNVNHMTEASIVDKVLAAPAKQAPAQNAHPRPRIEAPANLQAKKNLSAIGSGFVWQRALRTFTYAMVPTTRLELVQLSPLPPQDSVSTNSTTSARQSRQRY